MLTLIGSVSHPASFYMSKMSDEQHGRRWVMEEEHDALQSLLHICAVVVVVAAAETVEVEVSLQVRLADMGCSASSSAVGKTLSQTLQNKRKGSNQTHENGWQQGQIVGVGGEGAVGQQSPVSALPKQMSDKCI